jgi:hypothetical protein
MMLGESLKVRSESHSNFVPFFDALGPKIDDILFIQIREYLALALWSFKTPMQPGNR